MVFGLLAYIIHGEIGLSDIELVATCLPQPPKSWGCGCDITHDLVDFSPFSDFADTCAGVRSQSD